MDIVWSSSVEPCPGAFANSAHLGANFQTLQAANPIPLATSGLLTWLPDCSLAPTCLAAIPPLVYPVPVYGDVTVINRSFLNASRFTGKVDHIMNTSNRFTGTFLLEDSDTGDERRRW